MDGCQRALDGATALLEAVGAGACWSTARAIAADCLGSTSHVYVEAVAAPGTSVWTPADHDALPRGRVAAGLAEWHGRRCARGPGHHVALPVSASSVLVLCRPDRRFDAGDWAVARSLLPLLHSIRRHAGRPELTPRELAVLQATADGLTATAAGRRLDISARTFEKHRERLYRKLGTRDRVHAVLLAQDLGILPVSAARPAAVRLSGAAAAT